MDKNICARTIAMPTPNSFVGMDVDSAGEVDGAIEAIFKQNNEGIGIFSTVLHRVEPEQRDRRRQALDELLSLQAPVVDWEEMETEIIAGASS